MCQGAAAQSPTVLGAALPGVQNKSLTRDGSEGAEAVQAAVPG